MDVTTWLLGAAATTRLTLLVTRDTITQGLRDRAGTSDSRVGWWTSGVTGCPWCASPYVAAAVAVTHGLPGWSLFCTVAAWSLLAGLAGELLDG